MDSPDLLVMGKFIAGAIRSGLGEQVCTECGRPWLTRTPGPLCPVCNPEHDGHEPGGATDKARWVAFWRRCMTGVLRSRAGALQHRRRELAHAIAIGPSVYPRDPVAERFIRALRTEPPLDESDPEWREGWSR